VDRLNKRRSFDMKPAVTVARVLIELSGASLLVLGILFWLGRALALVYWHVLLGAVLVLCLWLVAGLALRAGASKGLILLVLAWSLIMPALGIMQLQLLPGQYHWLIRVLHLAVGVGAVGLGQALARRAVTPSLLANARLAHTPEWMQTKSLSSRS
jgi:hypothetical protein